MNKLIADNEEKVSVVSIDNTCKQYFPQKCSNLVEKRKNSSIASRRVAVFGGYQ